MPRPIIIDCDPGLDDAIALAMALRSPELDVKAITTSAGNQTPEKTLHNALGLLTLMQREDIPVAAGARAPEIREHVVSNTHKRTPPKGYPPPPTPTKKPEP
ncbi:nucleoside hydrolase, partial [Serratia sp. IR-2025]